MTSTPGSAASTAPGRRSLLRRRPDPTTTCSAVATAGSSSTGRPAGSPGGVMPPYSIKVLATASSGAAKDALRTSSHRRTTPLTSARVVAEHDAADPALRASSLASDHYAVGAGIQWHLVVLT